ncbi:unnamed protein product [Caretta caretta]
MLGELVAGATGGLVLIQDTVECEGRSLLKTFAAASAHRGESVHVFGFEIPEEEFRAGFDPDVTARLLYQDGFTDPLRWTGEAGAFRAEEFSALGVAGRLARGPAGPATVVLDSLSWLLLRQPLAAVCQTLERIPRAAACAGGILHRPGRLHPKALGEPAGSMPQDEDAEPPSAADPTANLTFNLRLSDTERQARDGLLLPFHFTAQKKSSLLEASANAGKIFYEPDAADDLDEEDPDDDLDV